MLIHLWLLLLIPSIALGGDKGKGSKPKKEKVAKASGSKAAKKAEAAQKPVTAPPAPAKVKVKRPPKGVTFAAPGGGEGTTKKRRTRERINGTRIKKSTTPITTRTHRTTLARFITQSWNEDTYGKLDEGILLLHNQNPISIVVHELTHFIEKDNKTIYQEKYINLILDHNTEPREMKFRCHDNEETKDRWSLYYTYFRKNYTVGDVYFNLKKAESQRPICVAIDNLHRKHVKFRQPMSNQLVIAELKEV